MIAECPYSPAEQRILLDIARQSITAALQSTPYDLILDDLPAALIEPRACFVTLFTHPAKDLRGCTGTLAARVPLAKEVAYTARQTAFHDPRFYPVTAAEVPDLRIEISILTPPQPFPYKSTQDLLARLCPGRDGVTLHYRGRRATFLPQVWERISDPSDFLDALCHKLGVAERLWQWEKLEIETYTAIMLMEPGA